MLLVAAAVVAVAFLLALRRELAPALRLAASWARVRPLVGAYARAAPATFVYLAILAVTTWVLAGVTPGVARP